jgi:ABC-type Fe3+ transport system substrate-binding protein
MAGVSAAIEIEPTMTLLEVTERYPRTIEVFVESGFPKMRDPERRRAQGRSLTVAAAARLRRIDAGELVRRLVAAAREEGAPEADVTLAQAEAAELQLLPPGDIRVSGLLPCPVRLPILEVLGRVAERVQREHGKRVGLSLAAAAVGGQALVDEITRAEDERALPEIFISAGFESFFDRRALARFKDAGTFVDLAPPGQNAAFGELALRDPDRHFTMLGVVPAVFLVNRNLLGGEPAPRTWSDVLEPRFAGRLALPVGDFDLFNGLLLTIAKLFGDDGVRALARNMLVSRHPAETVGRFAARQAAQPAVSVIPYFFSKMTMKSQVLHVTWPEDGAIVSPIFMLVKRSALPLAGEVARAFLSREVGELCAQRGLMPVLDPEVDNRLPAGVRFLWLGWDRIRALDVGAEIPRLEALFRAHEGGAA